jgi:hypothetical protein
LHLSRSIHAWRRVVELLEPSRRDAMVEESGTREEMPEAEEEMLEGVDYGKGTRN